MERNRKAEVLALLEQSGKEYVSGEMLCRKLGVSRTAVWKIINRLKEEGYEIEGVSNRGYRLTESPDLLNGETCMSCFHGNWACTNIESYAETDSTNERAKEAFLRGAVHGTLILADSQTAGKGRRGRVWQTPKGTAIAMTTLLRPEFPPEKASMLTLVMALSLAKGIGRVTGLETAIKWPNDIVVGGRKLCGILTEMSADMDSIHYVIIGTGINVNIESFPEDIAQTATSLLLETGHPWKRALITAAVMEEFEKDYEAFMKTQSLELLKEDYEAKLVNRNSQVRVLAAENSFTGIARGIDETGCLLVEKEDGTLEKVLSGEVSVRGIYGYV